MQLATERYQPIVQPQRIDRPEPSARSQRPCERVFAAALVSALTLFSVIINGYHPYAEDGGLYLAGVKRLLDPALYPHGTAFVLEPMRLSFFAPTLAALVRLLPMTPDAALHRGLPVVLLALHLASIWATLFAAWLLATRCWTTRAARAGAVTLLACWLSLPVAGTALLIMDAYVTARSLSTPALLLALIGVLDWTEPDRTERSAAMTRRRRGFYLCAGSLTLATVMHPLMAAYALAATLMLLATRAPRRSSRVGWTLTLAVTALVLAALLQAVARPESAEYLRVALTRTYWFIAQWRWFEWAGLAAPLAILSAMAYSAAPRIYVSNSLEHLSNYCRPICLSFRSEAKESAFAHSTTVYPITEDALWPPLTYDPILHRKVELADGQSVQAEDARRALLRMAVAVGVIACLIAALFARAAAATHLVARLQPLRAFQCVYLVLVLILGAHLGERILRRSAWRWVATLLLLGGVMLGAERAAFPHSNHLELPAFASSGSQQSEVRNQWVQAFLWIREHTPKDALFALDADYINAPGEDAQCFRAIAERSSLADYSKDGGEASIAPDLTAAWAEGQAAQQRLSSPATTDAERLATLRPLGVSWLVLQASATTSLNCPFSNAAVKVCQLP
ncbi:MAG: hypothetical protein P4K80_07305 [Acidobacteriaceae bacterium]|nr:hypothetical protein [Acidobacteriaceae bacterium]